MAMSKSYAPTSEAKARGSVATPLTNQPPNLGAWKDDMLTIISTHAPAWYPSVCEGKHVPTDFPTDPSTQESQDPVAMKKWELKLKTAEEKEARMEAEKPVAYGLIWSSVSESSRLLLKAHDRAGVEKARQKTDVISLWEMIEKTHSAGVTSSSTQALQAELEFNLRQKQGQSVLDYMEEATQSIDTLAKLGVTPDDKMLAFRFLKGLTDPIFTGQIERWTAENSIPADFAGARKLTFDWYIAHKKNEPSHAKHQSNAYVTKDDDEKIICLWCEKKGHSAQECTKLIAHKARRKATSLAAFRPEDLEYPTTIDVPFY